MEDSAGIVATTDEVNFSMRNNTVLTFSHGFLFSPAQTCTKWIRHPMAVDGLWWQILVMIHEDDTVQFLYKCKSDENSVARSFTRAFSFVIFKKNLGSIAKGRIPWFNEVKSSDHRITLTDKVVCAVPSDKTFFVNVSLSILNDQEIIDALLQWSVPAELPVQCAAQDRTIFRRLWNSSKSSDLVIETSDGPEINAHRCILIESSSVFAAMFTEDTPEKTTGRLKLDACEAVVLELLQFFYLEFVSSRDTGVLLELVKLADRYDVPDLKMVCEVILVQQVTSDYQLGMTLLPFSNTFGLETLKSHSELALVSFASDKLVPCLHLAVEYSAQLLLRHTAAMLFVLRCNIMEDTDWKDFEVAYPDVAIALLTEYMKLYMDPEYSGGICVEVQDETNYFNMSNRHGRDYVTNKRHYSFDDDDSA